MMNDPIRELMDSCRPQGDDLSQPEMQPLAELVSTDATVARQLDRSRRLDRAIAGAVHDVPIPAGLEQRLLAAVANSQMDSPPGHSEPSGDPPVSAGLSPEALQSLAVAGAVAELVTPRHKPVFGARRLWAALAACAAVLALILVPLAVNRQRDREVGYQELVSSALNWLPLDDGWSSDDKIWTSYPLPRQLPATRLDRRQQVQLADFNLTAYCYDVVLQGGSSARIFVFDKPRGFALPAAPPVKPMFTQGKCVAAWTSGGLAYVMVLDGGEDDYKRLIQSTSQLASLSPVAATSCPTRTV